MELDRYAKEKQERCSLVLSKTHDYVGSGVEASLSIKEHTGERTARPKRPNSLTFPFQQYIIVAVDTSNLKEKKREGK